jgi:hypothetical protein
MDKGSLAKFRETWGWTDPPPIDAYGNPPARVIDGRDPGPLKRWQAVQNKQGSLTPGTQTGPLTRIGIDDHDIGPCQVASA